MTSWRIWVRDIRQRALPRERVCELVLPALRNRGLRIDRGPDTIFSGKGVLPGEWSVAITDAGDQNADTIQLMLSEALARTGFQIRKPPEVLNAPAGESKMPRMRGVRSSRA
jgi:hypothetical protein